MQGEKTNIECYSVRHFVLNTLHTSNFFIFPIIYKAVNTAIAILRIILEKCWEITHPNSDNSCP